MIAILAGKASAGRDIARIVGADKKHDGYMSGNGYLVTWASGHLLTPASPDDYGMTHIGTDDMPFIPEKFKLVPRRNKSNKQPDSNAVRQLRIIKNVIKRCRSIIAATEPDEDGELLFRNIYHYFRCRKPFKRLWINSLTDEDIQDGFIKLKDGKAFDNIYLAASTRIQADWMIATNASRALCITSGIGNDSLGRLQTPVLAIICQRYPEHIHFVAKPYWQIKLQVEKEGTPLFFTCNEQFSDKSTAERIFDKLKTITEATVSKVEQTEIKEEPPLLYNLTELQKDANIRFGFTAGETLDIARQLYEKKLITFPKTSGGYISNKQFKNIYSLLDIFLSNSLFAASIIRLKQINLNSHCVNSRKIKNHPAILITGKKNIPMDENEEKIYNLIAGRMLEAFSPCCIKESVDVEVNCNGFVFSISGVEVKNKGWKEIYHWNDNNSMADRGNNNPDILKRFKEGESIKINSYNLIRYITKAKPLLTEAALLDAMDDVLDLAHKYN
ncbi:DNA topoisomerase-3 [Dysgonomonas sp. PFB1-18]|uniref:DNA topoisomerase n=1 Tax=Dysgonomonas sp. PF1-16 TaxID=2940631 RepID=UPI00247549FA|nr:MULTISPECIES: DNA topoisomerase [unclassified Dysgonomonas]MDH6308872.1 DNA topoisomerase-3 [Dysgonomonas sp. PF1-14]MDH6338432.1 DNA topoisomerase-3 [Dysgonomonas sp. PF1-16]MDH6380121.1 DNA topoisomerase-3 [Dysgonomonas sp. PFB1-18]MDH6397260.1 DNA topoisomerase-3 [Dysgonomonas sp. PF1-23]